MGLPDRASGNHAGLEARSEANPCHDVARRTPPLLLCPPSPSRACFYRCREGWLGGCRGSRPLRCTRLPDHAPGNQDQDGPGEGWGAWPLPLLSPLPPRVSSSFSSFPPSSSSHLFRGWRPVEADFGHGKIGNGKLSNLGRGENQNSLLFLVLFLLPPPLAVLLLSAGRGLPSRALGGPRAGGRGAEGSPASAQAAAAGRRWPWLEPRRRGCRATPWRVTTATFSK